MNNRLAEARRLVCDILERLPAPLELDVGIAPPAVLLLPMAKAVAGSPILLGAQNMHHAPSGAFTGELSAGMLMDAGCRFVIIGHSERRQLFGEAGDLLRLKVVAAVEAGLDVIYCIGETLEQRERGETFAVLERQLNEGLSERLDWSRITIAYEPVWAIGTGRHATSRQAQEAHRWVREWLAGRCGGPAAATMRIQYGGSVKPGNAAELLAMPDVDGALVGGASLRAADFVGIVSAGAAAPA